MRYDKRAAIREAFLGCVFDCCQSLRRTWMNAERMPAATASIARAPFGIVAPALLFWE